MIHSDDIQRAMAAVRANPRSPDLWVALGALMAGASERDKARDCYELALRLNSNHVLAKAGLAQLEQLNLPPAPGPISSRALEPPPAAPQVGKPTSAAPTHQQVASDKPISDTFQKQFDAPSPLSLAGRALCAILLTIGFYSMAIGAVVVLLYIPYAEWMLLGSLHIRLTLACILVAFVIAFSILPRRDRFTAPGPIILSYKHPKLFKTLTEVAKAVNQEPPAEVYLLPDVNAWVTQRGGFLGIGSQRVMGIGLPLLQLLTIPQLHAVLAHEFGHYYGGDTKLGPWVYHTRAAIGRTVNELAGSLIQKPFLWYAKLFIRVTHAISRQQELIADQFALRLSGPQAMIDGLRAIHGGSAAFHLYWLREVMPVLDAGFRPPILEGFGHFVNSGSVAKLMSCVTEHELSNGQSDPYDTHPPLRDRIAAIEGLAKGEATGGGDPPATSLLENVSELETRLLIRLAGPSEVHVLKPVKWEDVGTQVYIPRWEDIIRKHAPGLGELTPISVPKLLLKLNWVEMNAHPPGEIPVPRAKRKEYAASILSFAVAVALYREGWTLSTMPGDDVRLQNGELEIKPFEVIQNLACGELKTDIFSKTG